MDAKLTLVRESAFPDPAKPYGERVQRRLREDIVVWLTTVGADSTPQPNPVWFLWDGESILTYNRADARRLVHVRTRPRVAVSGVPTKPASWGGSFDGDGRGGDIIVLTGRAELTRGEAPPHEVPAYLAKYRARMTRVSGSPEAFSRRYPVPLRVWPLRVRGF